MDSIRYKIPVIAVIIIVIMIVVIVIIIIIRRRNYHVSRWNSIFTIRE